MHTYGHMESDCVAGALVSCCALKLIEYVLSLCACVCVCVCVCLSVCAEIHNSYIQTTGKTATKTVDLPHAYRTCIFMRRYVLTGYCVEAPIQWFTYESFVRIRKQVSIH